MKKDINLEIEETLNLLDQHQKVTAKPFFNTRLEARIEKLEAEKSKLSFSFLKRQYMQPILVSTLILINILTLVITHTSKNFSTDTRENELSNIIEFYELDQTEYYILTSNE